MSAEGLGNGIWAENAAGQPSESVTIENSSVHDADQAGADVSTGRLRDGMLLGATGATVEHNIIANVFAGFDIPNSANPLIQSNTTLNTGRAVEFRCTGSASITGNIFNDSQVAFHDTPSTITGNPLYSIDTIWSNTCP